MKKWKVILLIVMVLVIFVPCTSVVAVSDPMGAASPNIPDLFDSSKNPNPYMTTYRLNYSLDDTAGMFSPVEKMADGIANILFALQQGLAYLLDVVFYYAFEFSIYDLFKDLINLFITNMKGQLYDNVIVIIISFMGVFFFIKQMQRQVIQFWIAMIQTVLIVALGIFYFTQPAFVLEKTEDATKQVSTMVLAGINNDSNSTTAVVSASNELWNIFVHRPWQTLEFGDTNLANQYTDQVLQLSNPDDRKKIFERLESEGQWQNMGLKRVGFELMYLIPMLITFAILGILCGLVIMFQFLTMIIFMMGIFIMIIALIPGIGPRTLGQWFSKFVATAATKVVLVFFLSLIIAFNKALFAYADQKGWLITLILQVVVYVAIFIKRNELIDLFVNIKDTMHNPANAGRLMRTPSYAGVGDFARNSYNRFRRRDDIDYEEFEYNRNRRTEPDTSEEDTVIVENKEKLEPDSGITRSYDTNKDFEETLGANSNNSDSPVHYNEIASYHNEMRQYFKKSEEILEKQLEVLKKEAELKSRQTRRPPEYDARVRRAENREKMRQPRFDRKEIAEMATKIRTVERAGGKAEDLIPKSAEVPQLRSNPKSVMDIVRRNQENANPDLLTKRRDDEAESYRTTKVTHKSGNKVESARTSQTISIRNENENKIETLENTETARTRQPVGVRIRKSPDIGGMEKKKRLTD